MEPSTQAKNDRSPQPALVNGVNTPPAEEPKKASKAPLILGIITVVVAGSIGAYSFLTADQESTDDAQVESDVIPLAARVGGQVIKLKVVENQAVKAGDVIVQIDPLDYTARVAQAEAELASAKAQAASADAQVTVVEATAKGGLFSAKAAVSGSGVAVFSAQAQIASASASIARSQADLHKAEIDLGRTKELYAANAVPKERLDNAQAAYDSAQAQLQSAQAMMQAATEQKKAAESRVEEAKGRLDQSAPIDSTIATAHAQADLAHARIKSSEAALELAKNQLAYTTVTAPTDGFVSKLGVHEGQLISPGQPIVELVPAQTYMVANFKETQVGRIRPGQKVEISVDAFPGKKLEGKVESLSGGTGARFSMLPPDNASGNFVKVVQRVPVRIAWTNLPSDLPLRAGLSADATVYLK
jgi:membrane fusion protein (multidrug efflux system)